MDTSSLKNIQIIEKIGSGPNGEVFQAWDKLQQRQKAVKILNQIAFENIVRPRLGAIKKLGKIDHPNLAGSIEFIEDSQNPVIISDFIEGKNLVQIIEEDVKIKNGPFDILRQITLGLQELNRHQLFHGNLKLSNIFITNDNRVVLTDAYLSQLGWALEDRKVELSEEEFFYLSPEQALSGKQSLKSDFYTTGVILFRLITGEFPFGAFNREGILHAVKTEIPEFNRLLDFQIGGIQKLFLQRLMEKDPSARFINCGEILDTLKEIKLHQNEDLEPELLNPGNSNPRPYLMISILIALIFVLWLIVSGYNS